MARKIKIFGTITCTKGSFAGAQFTINDGEEIVLGSNPIKCDMVFKEKTISERHCSVGYRASDGKYIVTDFSERGTCLSTGVLIPKNIPTVVDPKSVLWIGSRETVVKLG